MLKSIQNFFLYLLNLVVPHRKDFVVVKKMNEKTIANLPKADSIENNDWITALFKYKDDTVRAIIWELKYRGTTLPLDFIGQLLFDEILVVISDILLFDVDAKFLLIPIPISVERRLERGYNQSEYIARSIIEKDLQHILLYAPQWFEKIRETPKQSRSESKTERMKNLVCCFEAKQNVSGYYVILIDDVVTTGSTLSEARRTILEAGATNVYAFTIAH